METLVDRERVNTVQRRLRFEGIHTVSRDGKGGGLALPWKRAKQVEILSSTPNFINAAVSIQGVQKFRLTGFSGYP
ncbi:hypothetical protein Scep_008171 [Stephania cephalantha]|uniref:Uncharacterized protein n=1 Tax=Stephania cephalantha TaxID=152367 RepID=A0AAP0KD48_9MAGN